MQTIDFHISNLTQPDLAAVPQGTLKALYENYRDSPETEISVLSWEKVQVLLNHGDRIFQKQHPLVSTHKQDSSFKIKAL
jgi:hypothetical protein